MGFTAPWLLAGLLLAALPVVLHLVQRREPPERIFPAVRYLEDATRDHRRRLRLRHLLLLVVRTLLVVALVLAAAGATLRRAVPLGTHPPSALVVVFDNSASSATVVDGELLLEALRRSADAVLASATSADRLWLLPADGVPRSGTPELLRSALATLTPEPRAMALGPAVSLARDLLAGVAQPAEIVVITDGQQSAFGAVRGTGLLTVVRPAARAPENRGVVTLDAGPQPWGQEGGQVTVLISGNDSTPVAATLSAGARALREVLLTPGQPATLRIPALPVGWSEVSIALAPDEFRLDDTARVAVRVAPPTPVRWDPGDRWLDAATAVLVADRRIRTGDGVRLGAVAPGPSVVVPPADPALLPALNRQLAARGLAWRYGAVVEAAERLDSGAVLPFRPAVSRRVTLERGGDAGGGDTLVRVDGAPWAVRDGDVILLGSRLDPDWTSLPLTAGFVPFLDLLLTRAARGELSLPTVPVGTAVPLPGRATEVSTGGSARRVEGGGLWRPSTPGVHYLLEGLDTLAAVNAILPAAESDLTRIDAEGLRQRWPEAVVRPLDAAGSVAFGAAGRGDLRPLLLLIALGCVIGESLLAGRVRYPPR